MTSNSRRCFSVRRLIILSAVLVFCRITWISIEMLVKTDLTDFNDFSSNVEFDGLNKPKECIMTANKTCVPVKNNDIYLGLGLYTHKGTFFLDGRPFRILSGSFHYFRVHPVYWGDRLLKMKAAGLNTVTTYIPWNIHEPIKYQYNFGGVLDLGSFIRQAQKVGLKVIVRPGPYICAEWEFGGLPAWLLHDPDMQVRRSYPPFLRHVEEYFSKLLPILASLAYKKGGPIIAFQVENEYGSYSNDKDYLNFLVQQYTKWRIEELWFTSDGSKPGQLENGSISGILATVNFQTNAAEHLEKLRMFQPRQPLMVGEFWTGWFDHWGGSHHSVNDETYEERLREILSSGASVNLYMFVGGTNFGFWNGANLVNDFRDYAPTVTSYDYDSPISEDGNLTGKYHITRKLILEMANDHEEFPDVDDLPVSIEHSGYTSVEVADWMPYKSLTDIAHDYAFSLHGNKTMHEKLLSMEELSLSNGFGQNVGWILYRTKISTDRPQTLFMNATIRDRAQILADSQMLATYYRQDEHFPQIIIPPQRPESNGVTLDIFVENLGRVNYKLLSQEWKGMRGNVAVGDSRISYWHHIPLDFDDEFIATLTQHETWRSYVHDLRTQKYAALQGPSVYRAFLNTDIPPKDTYLDMKGWQKGLVIVNGFVLGRYWHIGPQRTLYLPAPLLVQGRNLILVFELHQPHGSLTFTDRPILNDKW